MKNAFSLSITLWISAAMIFATIFFIKNNKIKIDNTSKLIDKLNLQVKNYSNKSLLDFYLYTGDMKYDYIENTNVGEYQLPEKIFFNKEMNFNNSTIYLKDTGSLLGFFNININFIDLFFTKLKIKEKNNLIDSLEDWLDKNDFYKINGAESQYYKSQKFNYTPRNENYISSLDELKLIKGWEKIDMKYFDYSTKATSNITTMDKFMLQALFNIKEQDIINLEYFRKKDIKQFINYFQSIKKSNYDPFTFSNYPTKVISILMTQKNQNASDTIKYKIDYANGTVF